jgi:hypothetical protein
VEAEQFVFPLSSTRAHNHTIALDALTAELRATQADPSSLQTFGTYLKDVELTRYRHVRLKYSVLRAAQLGAD